MSSRFFENQPNEICSHLSEKASKGKFFGLHKLQKKSQEEERRSRERSNGCTLSFYNGFSEGGFWPKKKTVERKGPSSFNPASGMYIIGTSFNLPKNIRPCLANPSPYI